MMTIVLRWKVVEGLRQLSDSSEQHRLWLSSDGEVGSFTECISTIWDDSGLGDVIDLPGRVVFDESIDQGLRDLHVMTQRIDAAASPDLILQEPLMESIRHRSAVLVDAIDALG